MQFSHLLAMADATNTIPTVEDIDLDGADDGPEEGTATDGAPVAKLTVRGCVPFNMRFDPFPISNNVVSCTIQAAQKKRLRAKRKKAAEKAAAGS